ncbi:MAG: DUF362 domain-containing protein [Proteobacteria bacterium]|nr:DUF362 domain-containing protein [Pseudomonadota bacterium]
MKRIEKYEKKLITDFLSHFISFQGLENLRGEKVLIKPNFLKPSVPERAIITHPEVIKSTIVLFKELGAKIIIGDSPGFGSIYKVIEKAELSDFLKRYEVRVSDFSNTKSVKIKGYLFKELDIPIDVLESDYLCNIAKLKTHQMMFLTMAVKNLYGCIYGLKKVSYHLTAGRKYEVFATLLLDIYNALKPKINILDGIIGMEGNGPSSGEPRNFGFMAIGTDALSLDTILCKILNVPIEQVPYLKVANSLGLEEVNLDNIKTIGIKDIEIKPMIKFPPNYSTNFTLPSFINDFINNFFLSYPEVSNLCRSCGVCKKHCPVGAITIGKKTKINKKVCIRCFCCQELCDFNAIKLKRRLF